MAFLGSHAWQGIADGTATAVLVSNTLMTARRMRGATQK